MNVKFNQYFCKILLSRYREGKALSLQLIDSTDGASVTVATVNLIDYGLLPPEGHCFVKNYSENEGILESLVKAGAIEPTGDVVNFGPFGCQAHICRLSPNLLEQLS